MKKVKFMVGIEGLGVLCEVFDTEELDPSNPNSEDLSERYEADMYSWGDPKIWWDVQEADEEDSAGAVDIQSFAIFTREGTPKLVNKDDNNVAREFIPVSLRALLQIKGLLQELVRSGQAQDAALEVLAILNEEENDRKEVQT